MLPQLRLLPSCLNGCKPGTASRELLRVLAKRCLHSGSEGLDGPEKGAAAARRTHAQDDGPAKGHGRHVGNAQVVRHVRKVDKLRGGWGHGTEQ